MAIYQTNVLPTFDPKDLTPERITELAKQSTNQGFRCGLSIIDNKLRGLQPAAISVTAKRGTGKSWLGIQLLHGLWKYSKQKGVFMTLEMSTDQLLRRMAQLNSGLMQDDMQNLDVAKEALEKLQAEPFFQIVDCRTSGFNLLSFENSIRSLVSQGYSLFIVDHLHRTAEAKSEKWADLDKWPEKAHFLASELKTTIVMMAQAKKGRDKISFEDTKGSGGIIDAVDQGLTINYLSDGKYLFTIEKNRLGDGQYESQIYMFTKTGQFVLPIDSNNTPQPDYDDSLATENMTFTEVNKLFDSKE